VWGIARSDQSGSIASANFRSSRCDVSDWDQVTNVAAAIESTWGKIDAIIAAAGVQGAIGPAMNVNPKEWAQTIHANLSGSFFLIRALFKQLSSSQNRAKVICFSGGGSTAPRANFSAYGAAKTALVRLVETLAAEWSADAVDINAVAPGAIYTRLTEEVLRLGPSVVGEQEYQGALRQTRDANVALEKVGDLIDFLLSSRSDGVTGRLLSAPWDPWKNLSLHQQSLMHSDVYTLRRILPQERNLNFE